jgi:mRNA interferase MazF
MSEGHLRRGDVVVAILAGDYGKPRPVVVAQADLFNGTHESVVVCPISSKITGLSLFRVPLGASETTGLKMDSEIMVDKIGAAHIGRVRNRIGRLSNAQLSALDAALRVWLELPE